MIPAFSPGPCRALFANGAWSIPEEARPADWQARMEPKPVELNFPKTPYLYLDMPAHKGTAPKYKPKTKDPKFRNALRDLVWTGKVGRPKGSGRLGRLSAKDIVAREAAGQTVAQFAVELNCNPSHLYRMLQKAPWLERPQRMCALCHQSTERAPNAKYCAPCAKASNGRKWRNARKAAAGKNA